MRLKSIKLAGFKSFVDKTTVPFVSNMTAVVGPNGCGKSNIIDAVRWVMGESSAKHLRGESMTDVIFNGSSGRQPVGQATIELLFENNKDSLFGEYASFSEISIKRKVTREGISQYYLNGSKCRRRDVTDIFLGTGMGPRSYAIIEQGMIAKLIESKPEELRVYLEEAAGISKYKERRRETENRMRRTQENLDRLADIREELGKQLQHLKRQANAAERYAELKKDERYSQAKLNAVIWLDLDCELDAKVKEASAYERNIEDAVITKNIDTTKVELLRAQIDEGQEKLNNLQAKFYQTGADISAVEQEILFNKTKVAEQDKLLSQLDEELDISSDVLAKDIEVLNEIEEQLLEVAPLLDELTFSLAEEKEKIETKKRDVSQWDTQWDRFNVENSTLSQTANSEKAALGQNQNKLQEQINRREKVKNELSILEVQLDDLDINLMAEERLILEEKIVAEQESLLDCVPLLNEQIALLESTQEEKNSIYKLKAESSAVLASLNTLQQAAIGENSELDDDWLASRNIDTTRLMESIRVSEGWEVAVSQVLEYWLTSYTVSGATIEGFNTQELSGLSNSMNFIASDVDSELTIKEGTLASVVTGASPLVGILNQVLISQNDNDIEPLIASLMDSQSLITQQGVWHGKNWLRYFKPGEGQDNFVTRTRRISEVENQLDSLESRFCDTAHQEENIKNSIQKYSLEERNHESQIKVFSEQLSSLTAIESAGLAKLDQLRIRVENNKEDLKELGSSIQITKDAISEGDSIWQAAEEELGQRTEEKAELLSKRELLKGELEQIRNSAGNYQDSLHQTQLHNQSLLNKKDSSDTSILRLNTEIKKKQEQLTALKKVEKIDESLIPRLALRLEGLLETHLSQEESLNTKKKDLESVNLALRDIEKRRSEHDGVIQSTNELLSTVRMAIQALRINQDSLNQKVEGDNYTMSILCAELGDDNSADQLSKHLEQLQSKISRLGAINLAAVDEYKEQSKRKTYLDEQNDDLEEALETLLSAIRKIDKETRIRFKETFDQVNEGLQRLFPKIFGGGSASLTLTDDNLLETGVVIVAQPPGKKNATIHLLSGGEKSLTAIALIFAIFELNPAPFCMLDEVDAPLDDANVGRFANLVKEMSNNVQFIYISHNKISMEKADQLMGVTMHEPGVSRLVSVDVDQAVAMVDLN